MDEVQKADAVAKVRIALGLADAGIRMKRQNLVRSHPDATAAEIEDQMAAWFSARPPDGVGRIGTWPRTR